MIPLYGFLQGDTLGLLILARPEQTIGELAQALQQAARVRVRPYPAVQLLHAGAVVRDNITVHQAGLTALDRFDVVPVREGAAP